MCSGSVVPEHGRWRIRRLHPTDLQSAEQSPLTTGQTRLMFSASTGIRLTWASRRVVPSGSVGAETDGVFPALPRGFSSSVSPRGHTGTGHLRSLHGRYRDVKGQQGQEWRQGRLGCAAHPHICRSLTRKLQTVGQEFRGSAVSHRRSRPSRRAGCKTDTGLDTLANVAKFTLMSDHMKENDLAAASLRSWPEGIPKLLR